MELSQNASSHARAAVFLPEQLPGRLWTFSSLIVSEMNSKGKKSNLWKSYKYVITTTYHINVPLFANSGGLPGGVNFCWLFKLLNLTVHKCIFPLLIEKFNISCSWSNTIVQYLLWQGRTVKVIILRIWTAGINSIVLSQKTSIPMKYTPETLFLSGPNLITNPIYSSTCQASSWDPTLPCLCAESVGFGYMAGKWGMLGKTLPQLCLGQRD